MSNSQHNPSVTQSLSQASGEDALSTNSTEPDFGPATAPGELGRLADYRIQKQLGKGGMGAVYLAFDEGLRRQAALKVMLPKFAADPLAKERFLREARAAAAVRNDHVVTIFQVGEDRGVPFIAMDYLSGYPLDVFLKRSGRLTTPQAMRVGLEVATGLAAAHALGLVHRDIKPANLWLEEPQGRIKILDFGLARNTDGSSLAAEVTAQGAIVGTPAFMSPEQARGEAVDHRSDLFSLGAVLYHLVAGKLPFERPTVMAMMIALATEDPLPVQSLNPEVPPPFAALIHQLLAKKPDHRPASATDVANTLRTLEYQLANHGAVPMNAAQPQVVYVPIQMTGHEGHNLDAFANLDAATVTSVKQAEHSQNYVEMEEPSSAAAARGGIPMWVVALTLLLVGGVVAGVFAFMKKPADVSQEPPVDPQPKPPQKVDPQPKPPENPDTTRRLAQWVLDKGGEVVLSKNRGVIKPGAKLPVGSFETAALRFEEPCSYRVTDDDLEFFSDATVKGCYFAAPANITDKGLEKLSRSGLTNHLAFVLLGNSPGVTDAGMDSLARFSKLVTIGITNNPNITDAGVAKLNNLTELRVVGFDSTRITDAGLAHLAGMKKLERVEVNNTSVTLAGAKKLLIAKPDLQVMMDYNQSTDPDYRLATWVLSKSPDSYVNLGAKGVIKKIDQLPRVPFTLMGVTLSKYVSTDDDVQFFADTTVTHFTVNTTAFTDKGWMKWSKFPNVGRIELLRIAGPAVNDNAAYHLIAFQGLQTLEFRDAEITDVTLRRLAILPSLKTLILRNTKVTADGVKALKAKKPELQIDTSDSATDPERRAAEWVLANKGVVIPKSAKSVAVRNIADLPKGPFEIHVIGPGAVGNPMFHITDAEVDLLLPLTGLEVLEAARITLTDDGLKKLSTAAFALRLTALQLSGSKITDAGLEHLKAFTTLQTLWLQGTGITDEGLKHLAGLKKLQYLNLKGTNVTKTSMKALLDAIPGLKIDFDYDPNTDPDRLLALWVIEGGGTANYSGGPLLVNDPKKIPSGPAILASVVVKRFSDADVKRFEGTPELRIMNYDGKPEENQLTDSGLAEWAKYPGAAKLQILTLGSPKVTDEGIAHLTKFTSLNTLDLRHTGITDMGLKKLSEMKSLQTLDVKQTKITPEGAKAFREAVPNCKLITDFDKP